MAEAVVDVERLKLGPTKLWTGLVLHHKDVFVSHVIPKLNRTDRCFFSLVNRESWDVLQYAGVNVSELRLTVAKCSSISTLEVVWNNFPWGEIDDRGRVTDQAWFCWQVATTNKLEFLKWAREVKQCEWDEKTIAAAVLKGNLEILKYCFSNGCPCDEEESCKRAAMAGYLDCVRFLFDKVKPSRKTEKEGLWQCEKERERDERICECKRGSVHGGEIVVSSLERVGVASQGCVCVARASEIERDGSGFLFKGE